VSPIDRKLVRDLRSLLGQLVTIALVVACGIAAYVVMQSTWSSLHLSRDRYYESYRFADVFARLKRAPEALLERVARIEGVARAQSRVVEPVMLPMPTMTEPATGVLVSVPTTGQPMLNGLHVRSGRWVERTDEVLVLQSFADAHGLAPGDRLPVVLNGTLRQLRVAGTALSPEYVYAMSPQDLTVDNKRFAVLWMLRGAMAPAFEMDGAFNDLALGLQPGASLPGVLDALERLLAPYGCMGAVGRDKQMSNFMLNGELSQLRGMATVVPTIFLAVAALLLNVVLSRLVRLQRPEIATLKAVGYRDREIAIHYVKLISVIVIVGAALGLGMGAYLGEKMTALYERYFQFPVLAYRFDLGVAVTAVAISLAAALVGALGAALRVARLPPAEAMRPPPPASYRPTVLERLGLFRLLGPSTRMVVREIERRPLRTLLSSFGIAAAIGIMVVGLFWNDATDFLINVQFRRAMREDVSVAFIEPRPERAVREIAHVPGVLYAEGLRTVPVRFRVGSRYRDAALFGYPDGCELRRLLERDGREVALPAQGVMLTRKLAEILGVGVGDQVEVEIREGDRAVRSVPVAALIDESFGLQGHMRLAQLRSLLREAPMVSEVLLRLDPSAYADVQQRLKELPAIASVTRRDNVAQQFQEQSGDMMTTFTVILTLFAAIIAIGVVYNNARVALSMRERDLASLRVLGFTRMEISAILLGELSVQLILAIPVGLVFGTLLAHAMMTSMDAETYRFAVIISARTYTFATVVALASGLVSALLVRRKLDQLDLIGVLKTRE
jgi:putative ABC transport system permease protein